MLECEYNVYVLKPNKLNRNTIRMKHSLSGSILMRAKGTESYFNWAKGVHMLPRSYSSLTSQCEDWRMNIILFHFHLKWGSTYCIFFYSKLVNKGPLNYSFCNRLLNLTVFKCFGRSVSDFSQQSLKHKGLEWVIQMARVLMAIFFKGDFFSLLVFCPFLSIFFYCFSSLQETHLATSQGQITDDIC